MGDWVVGFRDGGLIDYEVRSADGAADAAEAVRAERPCSLIVAVIKWRDPAKWHDRIEYSELPPDTESSAVTRTARPPRLPGGDARHVWFAEDGSQAGDGSQSTAQPRASSLASGLDAPGLLRVVARAPPAASPRGTSRAQDRSSGDHQRVAGRELDR